MGLEVNLLLITKFSSFKIKVTTKLEAFASNHSANKRHDSVTSFAEIEVKASSFVVNFISEEMEYNTVSGSYSYVMNIACLIFFQWSWLHYWNRSSISF